MNQGIRYGFLCSIILLLSCNNNKLNSVKGNNDAIREYLLLASNNELPYKERDKCNQKAFSLIDLGKNDTTARYYLSESSRYYMRTYNDSAYKKMSRLHFKKSKQTKDTLNLARFYRFRAAYHRNVSKQLDSAFYFLNKSEKMYLRTGREDELAHVYYNKGKLQNQFGDYQGANFSANQSYSILKKGTDGNDLYDILNLMGNISHNLNDYGNAISYHQKALEIAKRLNLKPKFGKINYIATSLNNIGNSYKELKQYKTAIYYFEKGLKEKNLLVNDPESYAYLSNNLGFCMMNLKRYGELPRLFNDSARLFDSLKIKNEYSLSNIYLSEYYFRQKDTLKAIAYSKNALRLAKKSNTPYYYLIALNNAGSVDKNNASKYIKEYHETNDSLQFEQRKARAQFYKIQLETDEISQEKEEAVKQKWVITSIISCLLLIVILLFVIYRQRAKQKELQLFQIQQKTNNDIYQLMLNQQAKVEEARQMEKKRIASELHDGIMNRLASTRLNLFVLKKKNDQQTIDNCLTYIEDIHQIENEIRNISHNLNKEVFTEEDSFITLLEQFVATQNNHLKTKYELQVGKDVIWDLIPSEAKMHLYRIVQEASNNINKHAQAEKAVIALSMDKNSLLMSVSDNGIGFDTQKPKEGIGIKNIQQRIESLNGTFTIESKIDKGTSLYLSFSVTL